MRLIHKVICQAMEEAKGAQEYAQCAISFKVERPQLAQMYYDLANTECGHATSLHDKALLLIENKRKESQYSADVQEFCDERTAAIVHEIAEAKAMLEMYHK